MILIAQQQGSARKGMVLIVGLGNPKEQYKYTYHNLGSEAVDAFAAQHSFPSFKEEKKQQALVSKQRDVVLAKPQTFMNRSGISVKALVKKYNPQTLIVIHDEIDLSAGQIQIAKNRGSAGHKGVQSVITELGTKYFTRIRIGIQPESGKPDDVEDFVLKKYRKEEFNDSIQESLALLKEILL